MEGHTAWHRLLKYSQNQRFTTQLESMEGSQCESIRLYLSNNATTLSLEHPASVCKITLSLRTIFNEKKRILRWVVELQRFKALSPTSIKTFTTSHRLVWPPICQNCITALAGSMSTDGPHNKMDRKRIIPSLAKNI